MTSGDELNCGRSCHTVAAGLLFREGVPCSSHPAPLQLSVAPLPAPGTMLSTGPAFIRGAPEGPASPGASVNAGSVVNRNLSSRSPDSRIHTLTMCTPAVGTLICAGGAWASEVQPNPSRLFTSPLQTLMRLPIRRVLSFGLTPSSPKWKEFCDPSLMPELPRAQK